MTSLTDTLPLRSSTAWGGYRIATPLPHRYGQASGELIQYDETRRLWCWADHPSERIDAVLLAGVPVSSWVWRNATDTTGKSITIVEFVEGIDEGVTPFARGYGKLDPDTGGRLTNPADVLFDLLVNIAGRTISRGRFAGLRAECDDIVVGGSLEGTRSVVEYAREICMSIGAIFAPDTPRIARLWPGDAPNPVAMINDANWDMKANAVRSDLVNELTLQFRPELGQPQQSVTLEAPDSIARFGRRASIVSASWLVDSRTAVSVGLRMLAQSARRQWKIEADGKGKRIRVGDAVTLQSFMLDITQDAIVTESEFDPSNEDSRISAQVTIGSPPVMRLASQSQAFAAQVYAAASVSTQGDQRVLTLREQDGRPIADAGVTLDGSITRYSDAAGRVLFPAASMPPGEHHLVIVTTDGRTLDLTVVV